MKDGRFLLIQEMTERRTRNPSYSLRAFARDVGVSPAALSQYLNRKRELSPKNRNSIVTRLGLSPLDAASFGGKATRAPSSLDVTKSHAVLSEDEFQLISDWVSVAILNLARLKANVADPQWIAERLGLNLGEARESFDRLMKFGLIKDVEGRMERTARPFVTSTDVPSAAIRRFHAGLLRRAEHALLNLPVEARDITAITMPADPAKLSEAKKILQRTRHRISKLIGDCEDPQDVFVLAMQLFPITESRTNSRPKGQTPKGN
ncbi:MAG: TIGR02147 family protein [Bdellovibrionaceae bacterium]|nr:TIGR02147 family protein [Pseudobdellovibrionaceae bacterium]